MVNVLRSAVFFVDIEHLDGLKPYVIVSSNARNSHLPTYLGVRVTTSVKPEIRSIVKLPATGECVNGSVVCDDVTVLYDDELRNQAGFLTRASMAQVDDALRVALSL